LLGLRLGHDGQDFDSRANDIIENADLTHAKPVLRLPHPAQALYATTTDLRRFVAQMGFKRGAYGCTAIGAK